MKVFSFYNFTVGLAELTKKQLRTMKRFRLCCQEEHCPVFRVPCSRAMQSTLRNRSREAVDTKKTGCMVCSIMQNVQFERARQPKTIRSSSRLHDHVRHAFNGEIPCSAESASSHLIISSTTYASLPHGTERSDIMRSRHDRIHSNSWRTAGQKRQDESLPAKT